MTPLLQSAGWALMHFVWQGAAVAVLAALALRLTARRAANVRYVISCVALLSMLAAPAITVRLLPPAEAAGSATGATAADHDRPRNSSPVISRGTRDLDARSHELESADLSGATAFDSRFSISRLDRVAPGVALAWLAGVALLLGRMAGGWWRVRRLHRAALATPSSRWQTTCRRLAYRLGLPAAAHVIESVAVEVPTVVGWLRPAILLPVAALATLTPPQVEAIIAHELAHIRRHDYAVNLLQTLAETLLFYHPAVWWISNRIRVEREHCCDEVAISVCGDRLGYAQALAQLESWRSTGAAMAMAATGGSLTQRVRRILQLPLSDEPRSTSWAVTLALTLVFTAGAGSVQHLPWSTSHADARVATLVAIPVEAQPVAPVPPRPPVLPAVPALPRVSTQPLPPEPPEAPVIAAPPAPPAPTIAPPTAPLAPPAPPVPPAPATAVGVQPAPPLPPAPPASPAPPTPPAPPAPPAPPGDVSSFSSHSERNEWRMQFSDNGVRVDVTLRGTIAFTDDLTDVQSLSDGGSFMMRDWSRGLPRTVEIKSEGGTLRRTFYVGGVARPWDEEARRFLATQLPLVVRRTGIAAEPRVRSIFERKGVNGVLEEIDLLGSDHARRLYLVALVDTARLDASGVRPVLARVGQRMRSDYDRRVTLQHIATRVPLDSAGATAYLEAMSAMTSDYDQRLALGALLKSSGANVSGDAMVAAIGRIDSSYDKRLVLAEVIGRGAISADSKRSVLRAAETMSSDYDRALVLTAYVDSYGVEPALRDPFFAAVRAIKSDYDRRRVLTGVAKRSVPRDIQQAAFDVVSTMSSDYDRAEILLAFVSAQGVDASIRPAFVAAAERLKSSYDQNRVLAALARSERR